jgi:hypothetical protein
MVHQLLDAGLSIESVLEELESDVVLNVVHVIAM